MKSEKPPKQINGIQHKKRGKVRGFPLNRIVSSNCECVIAAVIFNDIQV